METINHECYVSLEVAKLLKKAGFNLEVKYYYRDNFDSLFCNKQYIDFNNNKVTYTNYISAPTIEVAQRWLREVKNCYVDVEVFVHNLDKNNVYSTYNWAVYFNNDRYSGSDTETTRYYEVAQEASIKKALEIILEKGGQHDL